MKVVLLAGGYGSRLSEETRVIPKPLVEIGGQPILWHLLKFYEYYGFREFVICLGYKGELIKNWFKKNKSNWQVDLVDTGIETMTAGRLKRVEKYIGQQTFLANYSDGLGNVNLKRLLKHHRDKKKIASLTAAIPEGRFGALTIDNQDLVTGFAEKKDNKVWVNAGFFVFEPEIFKYISSDRSILEKDVLPKLAKKKQVTSFKYKGFWQPMDKLYDKQILEKLWQTGKAPWKVWRE